MAVNIQNYIAFITAVECGSITKAGEIMKYSHSAISRMIQALEQEWNVVLLERGKKGVQLTSDGIRLLPFMQRVCQEQQELQSQVDELNGLQSGIIRIGTFSSVATYWIPNMLTEFKKDYPNIDFELLLGDYEEIENWILEGRVDCGFLKMPTSELLDAISIEKDELMVVLPKYHPLAEYEAVPYERLNDYPFILLEKNRNTEISDNLKEKGVYPNVHIKTWDDYAIMSMVEKGFGISILHKLILQRIPYQVEIRSLREPIYREIGFATRNWETSPLAVRTFKEYIEKRH